MRPQGILLEAFQPFVADTSQLSTPKTAKSKEEAPKITDQELIGSYSWLEKTQAVILVPGTRMD